MLLLVIIALIATPAFYQRAKNVGIAPGRAASLPFIVLGILLIAAFIFGHVISFVAEAIPLADSTAYAIAFAVDLFLILAYLVFIRRNLSLLDALTTSSGMADPNDASNAG